MKIAQRFKRWDQDSVTLSVRETDGWNT